MSAILNSDVRFFTDGYELSGIQSVNFNYRGAEAKLKPLGTKEGLTTHSGPVQQSVSLSRVLVYDDPIFSYTGDASISGSIYYGDAFYAFDSGYLSDYSVNCAVGAVPVVNTNFQIVSEMSEGDPYDTDLEQIIYPTPKNHPPLDVPTQGSITVSCDGSSSNRVIGFSYSIKCPRKTYLTIGDKEIQKVELLPPLEYTASVQLEVTDAFLQDAYKFLEVKQDKDVSIAISGRSNEYYGSFHYLKIPNASLVSESLDISADGVGKLTLNYVGHSSEYEEDPLQTDTTYVFGEGGSIIDSTEENIIDYRWKKDDLDVYGLQLGSNLLKVDGESFMNASNLRGDLYINMDYGTPEQDSVIAWNAFDNCSGFDGELIVEEGLQGIEYRAFRNCNFNGNLLLPESVNFIGQQAFQGCSNFDGFLRLPDNEELAIGAQAFRNCSGLIGDLYIPDSISEIKDNTFYECKKLNGTLYLGTGIKNIRKSAFQRCSSLVGDLTMPEYLTGIEDSAFFDCYSFDGNLSLNDSLERIGEYAFASCSQIKGNLILPDSLLSIGAYAFKDCSKLSTITVGEGLDYINEGAFVRANLEGDVDFKNVEGIDYRAFYQNNIGQLDFSRNKIQQIGIEAFRFCKEINGDLILPDSLTYLGDRAFDNCRGLDGDLVIGDGLTEIRSYTFSETYIDGGLTLGQNIETIEQEAFRNAGFTNQLVLPDSLKNIEYRVFYGCGFTGDLVLHSGIKKIQGRAFIENRSIKRVFVDFPRTRFINFNQFKNVGKAVGGAALYANQRDYYDYLEDPSDETQLYKSFRGLPIRRGALESRVYRASNDEILQSLNSDIPSAWYDINDSNSNGNPTVYLDIGYNTTEVNGKAFRGNVDISGDLFFPPSIKRIHEQSFSGCKGLKKKLIFSEGIEKIDEYAFIDCDGFTGDLILPDSLTGIDRQIFRNCSGFNGKFKLGTGTANLGNQIFRGCKNLTGELYIPGTCDTVNYYAFGNCTGFSSLVMEEGVNILGDSAFRGCYNISNDVVIPDSIITISKNAFRNDYNMQSISIGNGTKYIGNNAFENCSGIPSIILRNNITGIGNGCFKNCSNVQFAYIDIPIEAIGNYNSLRFVDDGNNTSDRILFVSERYYNDYLTASTTSLSEPNSSTPVQGYFQGNLISIWPDDERQTVYYDSSFETLDSRLDNVPDLWKENDTDGSYLYIGTKTKTIGEKAFRNSVDGVSNLSGTLLLPFSLDTIKRSAFSRTRFSSVASQEGIKRIETFAFYGNQEMKTLTLPSSLEYVGIRAFQYLNKINKIKIGTNYPRVRRTVIDEYGFERCGFDSNKQGTLDLGYSVNKVSKFGFTSYNPTNFISAGNWIKTLNCSARWIDTQAFFQQTNLSELNLTEDTKVIGTQCFEGCTSLTDVVVPEPLTIWHYVFKDCNNINKIELGTQDNSKSRNGELKENSMRKIGTDTTNGTLIINRSINKLGKHAFYGDVGYKWIENAYLNCREIGYRTFMNQLNLNKLTFGPLLRNLGDPNNIKTEQCFYNCTGLTGVRIPGLRYLGPYSFQHCGNITGMYLGNDDDPPTARIEYHGGTNIGATQKALGAKGHVYIGSSVDSIHYYAFYESAADYSWIKTLDLGARNLENASNTEHGCFRFQSELETVTFRDTVKRVGSRAFNYCYSLTGATIPDPEYVGVSAFRYCKNMTGVYIGNMNSVPGASAGFNQREAIGTQLDNKACQVMGGDRLGQGHAFVGSSIDTIGSRCFNGFWGSDYYGYSWLKSAEIHSRWVRDRNFHHQEQMTGIKIGETVKILEDYFCWKCYSLSGTLTVPDPEWVGQWQVYGCSNLTGIYVGNDINTTNGIIDGNAYRRMGPANPAVGLGEVYIGSSIDFVKDAAFSAYLNDSNRGYYRWIKDLNLNCRQIGYQTFYYQSNIETINFGDNVREIGESDSRGRSFINCGSKIKTIRINNPEYIWTESFYGCYGITGIYLGNDTETTNGTIGNNAFRYIGSDANSEGYLYIGSSINYIGTNSFRADNASRKWLRKADLNCREIGKSAFYDQDNLTEINLGRNVNVIGDEAFNNCDGLTELVISDPLYLGSRALFNVRNLTGLRIGGELGVDTDIVGTIGSEFGKQCGQNVNGQLDVYIGDSINLVGTNAFNDEGINYNAIRKAEINSAVIGDNAFKYQQLMTGLKLGPKVKTIGVSAFAFCDDLKEIRVYDPELLSANCFDNLNSVTGVYIGNNVENTSGFIKKYAFWHGGRDAGVDGHLFIGSSIDTVSSQKPFSANYTNGRWLKSVDLHCRVLGSSLDTTSNWTDDFGTFREQSNLTTARLADTVKYVGKMTFNRCYTLTGFRAPAPKYIGRGVCRFNHDLTGVYVGNDYEENVCDIEIDAFYAVGRDNAGVEGITASNPARGHVYLGNSVNVVKERAFVGGYENGSVWNSSPYYGYAWIKTADISPYHILSHAFRFQTAMTDLNLRSTKIIDKNAFINCYHIKNIELTGDNFIIKEYAFNNCRRVQDLKLGASDGTNGTSRIEKNAFRAVGSITDDAAPFANVIIGRSVNYAGEYSFYGDYNWIGNALVNCKIVDAYAFAEQRQLTSLRFDWGCTDIRNNAFKNCVALKEDVIFKGKEVKIDSNAFLGCPIRNVGLRTKTENVALDAFPNMTGAFYIQSDYFDSWPSEFNGRPVKLWANFSDRVPSDV